MPRQAVSHDREVLSVGPDQLLSEIEEETLQQAIRDEKVTRSYRSYLPAVPLMTQPANCVDVHPTERRYCKVAIYRYMHQVEKERAMNKKNTRAGTVGETYVTWQFMPAELVAEKRRLGDEFFRESKVLEDPI